MYTLWWMTWLVFSLIFQEAFSFLSFHTHTLDFSYTPCFQPPKVKIEFTMRVVKLLSDETPFKNRISNVPQPKRKEKKRKSRKKKKSKKMR